jgi:hypothetical protein
VAEQPLLQLGGNPADQCRPVGATARAR